MQTERKKKEAERKALEWGREDGNYREQGHNDPDSEHALGARAQPAARRALPLVIQDRGRLGGILCPTQVGRTLKRICEPTY